MADDVFSDTVRGIARGLGLPEWQPIETAPKDGTYILLFGECRRILPHQREAAIGRWRDFAPNDVRAPGGYWTGNIAHMDSPTLWMPLPA